MSVATELTETEFAHPFAHPGAPPARRRLVAVGGVAATAAPVGEAACDPARDPGDAPVRRPGSTRTATPADRASVSVLQRPTGLAAVRPLHLTRRGMTVLTIAVALACGAVWSLAAQSAVSNSPAPRPTPRTVTVAPGDTLWAIAARVAPQRDPRAEVAQLSRRNHLVDAAIVPGQVLRVR